MAYCRYFLGRPGQCAERFLRKGSKVYVEGQLRTRKWQDQSGQDRYTTEVVLQGFDAKLVMLDGREGGSGSAGGGNFGGGRSDDGWGASGGYDNGGLGSSKNEKPRSSGPNRSEEHTSELQSLMRYSYAVFCLKKKKTK